MITARSGFVDAVPVGRIGHRPALDGLRGLAVLMVLLSHLGVLIPRTGITDVGVLDDFIHGGYLGVDLFFVLSGFLITTLILQEERGRGVIGFGTFYVRRALRLLPALYLFLLCFIVYSILSDAPRDPLWASVTAAVLYYSNWQIVTDLPSVAVGTGHLWSLAIEEQFYLFWPIVLVGVFGLRRSGRFVALVLLALILAVAVHRARLWNDGVNWLDLVVRTDTRADSLLVGALLASLWVRGLTPARGVPTAAWATSALLFWYIVNVAPDSDFSNRGGSTLFAFGVAVLILALLDGTWSGQKLLCLPVLQAAGRVSYGIYIWHLPIFYAVAEHTYIVSVPLRIGLALTLTAVATLGSWFLLERPALRVKDRLTRPGGRSHGPVPVLDGDDAVRRRQIFGTVLTVAMVIIVGGVLLSRGEANLGEGRFPVGDQDRSSFWRLAGLEAIVQDDFDRNDDESGLGETDTGQRWNAGTDPWRIIDGAATIGEGPEAGRLALVERALDDALIEVTLPRVAAGVGLVFNFEDQENYWTVTVGDDRGTWTVQRVVDGDRQDVAAFTAPTNDGVTVTVSVTGPTYRFLVDGTEYLQASDQTPDANGFSGLAALGPSGSDAQWDRFLVMVPSTVPGADGADLDR